MWIVPVPEKLRNHHPITLEVINDQRKLQEALLKYKKSCWKKVSRCRFVFAYRNVKRGNKRKGYLFFTDSHYGEDKISGYGSLNNKKKLIQQNDLLEDLRHKLIINLLKEVEKNLEASSNISNIFTQKQIVGFTIAGKKSELVNQILNALKSTLPDKTLQELLKINWLAETLKSTLQKIAVCHRWPDELVKSLQVKVYCIGKDLAKYVIKKLINENAYPFAKIGALTLTRYDDPKLSDSEWSEFVTSTNIYG